MSGVVFAVNRWKFFMESKKMKTFCDCKPSKKNNIEPHQNFTGFYRKTSRLWINSKIHRISKSKKVNKLRRKLLDEHKVNFKS